MSAPPIDGRSATDQLVALHRSSAERQRRDAVRQRSQVEISRELFAGAYSLESDFARWAALPPTDAAIERARHTVAGLQRLLGEMVATRRQQTMEADNVPAAGK